MKKFRKGDRIHVEYEISIAYSDGSFISNSNTGRKYIGRAQGDNDIIKHIPKPIKPLEPGDKVVHRASFIMTEDPGIGEILAIHDGRAWVKFSERTLPLSPLLESIKRVDDDD